MNNYHDGYRDKESRRLRGPAPKQPQIADRMTDALMKLACDGGSVQTKSKTGLIAPVLKPVLDEEEGQSVPTGKYPMQESGPLAPIIVETPVIPAFENGVSPTKQDVLECPSYKSAVRAYTAPRETISQQVLTSHEGRGVLETGESVGGAALKGEASPGVPMQSKIGGTRLEALISPTEPGLGVARLTSSPGKPSARKRYPVPARGQRTLSECRIIDAQDVHSRLIQLTKKCKHSKKSLHPRYQQNTRLAQLPGYNILLSRQFLADLLDYDVAVQMAWKNLMTQIVVVENEHVFDAVLGETVRWFAKMKAWFARKQA